MTAIVFRGPWPIAWVVWGVLRSVAIVLCIVAATLHGDLPVGARLALAGAYILWLPLELVGAWSMRRDPPGVETIRTWSQLNQWIGQHGRWHRWVALMNAAVDAFAVFVIFEVLNPIGAFVLAGLLFWRLAPHFNDRSDEG